MCNLILKCCQQGTAPCYSFYLLTYMCFGFSHHFEMPPGTILNSLLSVQSNRTANLSILELYILWLLITGGAIVLLTVCGGKKKGLVKQLRSTYRVKRNSRASSSSEIPSSILSQNSMVFIPFAATASKHIPSSLHLSYFSPPNSSNHRTT